jgi:UDP-glucose 4-epimerase
MSVLVTGGFGAIGSFVTRALVNMGIEPVVYDMYEDFALIKDIKGKVIFVQGDILDFSQLVNTVKSYGIKRIIHTVALLSRADPARAVRVNTQGTLNVLETAKECKTERVVYLSSKAVYNEPTGEYSHPTYKPLDEDYPKEKPMGVYGVTKFFGEQLGLQYNKLFGLDFVALRFGLTYGPGRILKNPNSPMIVPCKIVENAMLGRPTIIPRGGDQKDDMIYNEDTAHGVVLACFAKSLDHHQFNIGTGVGSSLFDVARAARMLYPDAKIEIGPGIDPFGIGFNVYSVYDISRAKNEIGFTPRYDVEKGIRDYVETMKRLGIEPKYIP